MLLSSVCLFVCLPPNTTTISGVCKLSALIFHFKPLCGGVVWLRYHRNCTRSSFIICHPGGTRCCSVPFSLIESLSSHAVFICSTNGIQYFSIIYKQFDAIIAEEVRVRMETGQIPGASSLSLSHWTVLEGDKEPVDIRPFELYLVLQVSPFFLRSSALLRCMRLQCPISDQD